MVGGGERGAWQERGGVLEGAGIDTPMHTMQQGYEVGAPLPALKYVKSLSTPCFFSNIYLFSGSTATLNAII